MISAAQPTVEVITAGGTDWAAIAAAIATGIAAIIGIIGTAWLAGRARKSAAADLKASLDAAAANQQVSIEAAAESLRSSNEAEERRALHAEKMRVYSEFQVAIDNLLVGASARDQVEDVRSIYRSAAEVTLIAPDDIGSLARDLARDYSYLANKSAGRGIGRDPIARREDLYSLMRSDLGTDYIPTHN